MIIRSKAVAILCSVLFLVTSIFMVSSLTDATTEEAQAYYSRLCSGYGSTYHTHSGYYVTYYHYTYSYWSGNYIYDHKWYWDRNSGWVDKGWYWC